MLRHGNTRLSIYIPTKILTLVYYARTDKANEDEEKKGLLHLPLYIRIYIYIHTNNHLSKKRI
jgi:hypothetical protein